MEPLNRVKAHGSLAAKTCDRRDVMTSLALEPGGFYNCPHAERQLEDPWLSVRKLQGGRSNQAVNGIRVSRGF